MTNILTDIGEEYYTETALDGVTLEITLYNDSTDTITETDDLAAITTEPGGASYAPQSDTFSVADINGDWGIQNDSLQTFDTSDSSQTIDHAAIIANFDSDEAGDGGTPADHLIGVAPLSQSRDLSQIDEYELAAGEVGVTID